MDVLGKDTIMGALRDLTGWDYRDGAIAKTFEQGSFRQAVAFFNRIADAAEQQQHHPDIALHQAQQVTVTLTTHSAGGVTNDDLKLATKIEGLAQSG